MPEPPPPDPAPPAAALAQPPPPEPAPAEVALPQPQPPSVATAAAAPAPPLPPAQPPNEPQAGAAARSTCAAITATATRSSLPNPQVLPASVNARFHNKEPVYPAEAQRRAEQGAVVLLIHVSPDGLPAGVDVVSSSGYALLDRAARDAVWKPGTSCRR